MSARLRSERGFTLVELLVSMTLGLVVLSATLVTFNGFEQTNHRNRTQNEAQDKARNGIDRIARELRNHATPTGEIPQAIVKAQHDDLVFLTVDNVRPAGSLNERNVKWVRYCLEPATSTVWHQELRWTDGPVRPAPASSACPNGSGWTTTQPLVEHVVNDRDANGNGDCLFTFGVAGCGAPTELAEVRAVDTTLFVDADPNVKPQRTRLNTTVVLRNQNRPPTAAFIAKPLGDRHVLLLATSSDDPEGQSLHYEWRVNGVVIPDCHGATCDYQAPTGATSVDVTLTVSDPADLTDTSDTQAVPVS